MLLYSGFISFFLFIWCFWSFCTIGIERMAIGDHHPSTSHIYINEIKLVINDELLCSLASMRSSWFNWVEPIDINKMKWDHPRQVDKSLMVVVSIRWQCCRHNPMRIQTKIQVNIIKKFVIFHRMFSQASHFFLSFILFFSSIIGTCLCV